MIITIDGPTASGKSTVARIVAQKFNIYYLCSGLLYRALGYVLLKHKGYHFEDLINPLPADVQEILDPVRLIYQYIDGKESVVFDGIDITRHLKTSDIDRGSSIISPNPFVRKSLFVLQHHIANNQSIVVDGRDTGSVVFPEAEYKFFITASLEERARRWRLDQEKRGLCFSQEQALAAVEERDTRDSQRKLAPLIVPQGAVEIDSTHLNKDEVVALIVRAI